MHEATLTHVDPLTILGLGQLIYNQNSYHHRLRLFFSLFIENPFWLISQLPKEKNILITLKAKQLQYQHTQEKYNICFF